MNSQVNRIWHVIIQTFKEKDDFIDLFYKPDISYAIRQNNFHFFFLLLNTLFMSQSIFLDN